MAKSCKGLATELVKCLSESDCIKVENRPYRECAKEQSPKISSECVGLRETYFNCKRGQGLITKTAIDTDGSVSVMIANVSPDKGVHSSVEQPVLHTPTRFGEEENLRKKIKNGMKEISVIIE